MSILLILVTLGCGGGGHTAMSVSFLFNIEHLVRTLTVLRSVYTHITTFVLPAIVAGVLSAAAGEAVL